MLDGIMTWILRLTCYGTQLAGLAGIAWGLARLAVRKKTEKTVPCTVLILLLEILLVFHIAYHPAVVVPEEYEGYVSREEIVSYSAGFYSANIPIFPVCASVTYADENRTEFTIQYLFWGSVEMSISEDGANMDRPLMIS